MRSLATFVAQLIEQFQPPPNGPHLPPHFGIDLLVVDLLVGLQIPDQPRRLSSILVPSFWALPTSTVPRKVHQLHQTGRTSE